MTENKQITANLYAFYNEVARQGKLGQDTIAGVPWVGSRPEKWPAYLLGGATPDVARIKEIKAAMVAGRVPAFWIREASADDTTEKLLGAHGIRRINYWIGMYREANAAEGYLQTGMDGDPREINQDSKKDLEIRKILLENEMDRWVELVNQVVMTSSPLDGALFRKLMYSDQFHFYGGWQGDEILSTTLIFADDYTAGLYFVATQPEQQGKGYGTCLVEHAMQEMHAAGTEKFVLHSTRQGLKLYQKTGFREVNQYDIYWLLGKR